MNSVKIYRGEVLLGICALNARGWAFVPNLSGRHPSRKRWSTWQEALPIWVTRGEYRAVLPC